MAAFIAAPQEGGHRFYGVMVFETGAEAISSITGFAEPGLSDAFGLPAWLPFDQQDRERGG